MTQRWASSPLVCASLAAFQDLDSSSRYIFQLCQICLCANERVSTSVVSLLCVFQFTSEHWNLTPGVPAHTLHSAASIFEWIITQGFHLRVRIFLICQAGILRLCWWLGLDIIVPCTFMKSKFIENMFCFVFFYILTDTHLIWKRLRNHSWSLTGNGLIVRLWGHSF